MASEVGGSITGAAGSAGVGAILLLGGFLFIDGRVPVTLMTVDRYAATPTWGVVAAVPVLAITYTVGVLVTALADLAMKRLYGTLPGDHTSDLLAFIGADKDSIIPQQYQQLRQEQGVLGGGAFGLAVLSIGGLSEISNLPEMKWAIMAMVIVQVLIAVTFFHMGAMKGASAHRIAVGFRSIVGGRAEGADA